MERAPLRPVPARPAGPVDPAAAIREVTAVLPTLAPLEARALALVALADRPRPQVADLLGIEEQQLGAVLAAARKELRQTITPLSGSGWCERAEGLISDRLDGAVLDRDARRLDVHLRNCPRCVEHERRLVQATDALLAGVAPRGARPGPAGAPTALVPVDDAGLLEDEALKGAPGGTGPGDADAADAAAADAADARAAGAGVAAAADAAAADDAAAGADDAVAGADDAVAGADDAAGVDAAASPSSDQIAAAAEVLVTARTRGQLAAAVTWNAMVAIALILTIASIALILAGILGAHL